MYPQPVHMLAQVRGGPEVVELNKYLEGKVGQRVHYPNVLRPESLPKRVQTRRLQAITGQVPVRETIMRWYRHKGMDLPEEYMRCHCGQGQETYEHFMRCAQYKRIEDPLARDQDVPLLKKGARGRSAVGGELGKEGQRKGLWQMVIVKLLWGALQEHTVASEAIVMASYSSSVKVLPWVDVGAGGLGAGKTSGAGTRGVSLDVVIGVGTGYTNTNGGESSDNRSKVHADCGPAENPSL